MRTWDELVKLALLGSERQNIGLKASGALGAALAKVYPADTDLVSIDREQALLDGAAIVSLYRCCGWRPRPADPPPGVCPPESTSEVSTGAGRHLSLMLKQDYQRESLPEWLSLCASAGRRAPTAFLPELLDAGRRDRSLRPALLTVIGERGRWLARFNPDWAYVHATTVTADAPPPEDNWETGDHTTRIRFLTQLRQVDPARARALLEEGWSTERTKERTALLATFADGLTQEDEAFLETRLDDKSKEVRKTAASLLARLPGSALCHRLAERLETWLDFTSKTGLMNKLTRNKSTLVVTIPDTWDPALTRDGITEKPPGGKGRKAWWLEQMLAFVPPSRWSARWGTEAADLLAAARTSDWTEPLLAGWAHATHRHADAEWAQALLKERLEHPVELWSVIPDVPRESLFKALLERGNKDTRRTLLIRSAAFPGHWGPGLTEQVARAWRGLMANQSHPDAGLYPALRTCARHMAPTSLPVVESLFTKYGSEDTGWHKIVADVFDILRFRADMLRAITDADT